MNNICLLGRLTADPEFKRTPNGISVCSFTVAIQRPYSGQNGERQADFINCVAWRQTAEFIEKYFKKGNMIGLNGSIQTRTYQDRDTGKNRTAFEVVINNAYFAANRANNDNNANNGNSYQQQRTSPNIAPQGFAVQQQQYVQGQQSSTAQLDNGFEQIATDDGDLPF